MIYWEYSHLTMPQILQMYSLHNAWNLGIALVTLGLVVGIIGFTIGLALGSAAPTTTQQTRPTHHHAA